NLRRLSFLLLKGSLFSLWLVLALSCVRPQSQILPDVKPRRIGFHEAIYDADGRLLPWTSWEDAIDREMAWYLNCPIGANGYPVFVYATFMDDRYHPTKTEIIPATQNGMGILSYLKYWEYKQRSNPKVLESARKMGDYLVREALTRNEGAYPRFTRSTGHHTDFPIKSSSQGDGEFGADVIEPDKGGLAGYALFKLFQATGDPRYFDQALHNAHCLARNMRQGDARHSPWPFRVDSVSGKSWGRRSGNMAFNLRLFDELIASGHAEFQAPRAALWTWIRTCQIPSADHRSSSLWVQFFEDQTRADNRTSWAPLEMARYLIERKEALDPDWKANAERLIQFSLKHFSAIGPGGVITMSEQDTDLQPWGGACSKLGGVAALFYAAGGGEQYREIAYRNLTWMMYHIDKDGCPTERTGDGINLRGGWQEDCHTDVIHNFMDALGAVPEWRGLSASIHSQTDAGTPVPN
ncbi:MAG: hypothetical protein KGN80_10595, partial [Acidobacteriota bacterium]|nr:hypothetical protein [Acidobacteriota bacterium]